MIRDTNRNKLTSLLDGLDKKDQIVNKLTADIDIPFALDEKMMRIENTAVHESVRERTCKLPYTFFCSIL